MNQFIGNGIYSISEAALLLNADRGQVARVLFGYQNRARHHESIIIPDYEKFANQYYLSFHDLIEVRFLVAFRKYGLSWQKIRKAAEKARELVQSTHPFCTKAFYTDGSTILTDYAKESGDSELLDLLSDQFEADKIFEPYLHHEFEYSDSDLIRRWKPTIGNGEVLLDPKYQFGQPLLEDSMIPTRPLFDAHQVEESDKIVANIFGCTLKDVEAAVRFELHLIAA